MPAGGDDARTTVVGSEEDLDALLADVMRDTSRRLSAIELEAADGSSLTVGPTGNAVVLMLTDALGNSVHSVGSRSNTGEVVVFDYFGSYTEVPAEFAVPMELGRKAMLRFLSGGDPIVAGLVVEPD